MSRERERVKACESENVNSSSGYKQSVEFFDLNYDVDGHNDNIRCNKQHPPTSC